MPLDTLLYHKGIILLINNCFLMNRCYWGIIITLLSLCNQQLLTYNFIIHNSNKTGMERQLYRTFISTDELCLGTPYQCEKIQFDPSTSLTVVLHKESENKNINRFNAVYRKSISSSYTSKNTSEEYFQQKVIKGYLSKDKFKFGPFEKEQGSFYLAETWVSEQLYSSIGLSANFATSSFFYFIKGLFLNKLIDVPEETIEIIDETKGKVVFGRYTLSNDYKKLFELNSMKYNVALYFDLVKIDVMINKKISLIHSDKDSKAIFDETFNFIQMPSKMRKPIEMQYDFLVLNCNVWHYEPRWSKEQNCEYIYYVCPKDAKININNYGDIIFDMKNEKLILRKENLFKDYDEDSLIFAIILKVNKENPQWIIGVPILKDIVIVRDFLNKVFSFYTKNTDVLNNSHYYSNNGNIMRYLFIVVIILMCIGLGVIGLIIMKDHKRVSYQSITHT